MYEAGQIAFASYFLYTRCWCKKLHKNKIKFIALLPYQNI